MVVIKGKKLIFILLNTLNNLIELLKSNFGPNGKEKFFCISTGNKKNYQKIIITLIPNLY